MRQNATRWSCDPSRPPRHLVARGVTLEPRGDRLAVRPPSLVTEAELAILRQHKVEILLLLTGPPPTLPGVRAWMYPWPTYLPGLGSSTVGPFELCSACSCGTWARFGSTPLCFACATARAKA
jgi:hypothetical protein